MTKVFVVQPLALPGSANKFNWAQCGQSTNLFKCCLQLGVLHLQLGVLCLHADVLHLDIWICENVGYRYGRVILL